MESWLTRITDYLVAQSWQVALLTVTVAVVAVALRNRSAHVRYLLWLVVLAKCLAPPVHSVSLAVLPSREPADAAFAPMSLVAEASGADPAMGQPMTAGKGVPSPAAMESASGAQVAAPPKGLNLRARLAIGWIVGAALCLLVYLLKALRMQMWLQRQRRALPAELQNSIERVFSLHEIKRLPDIWLVDGVGQPFVWGMVRGSIYLPTSLMDAGAPEHWAALIGHELSHVFRFDAAVNVLQVVAQTGFWFHPFVWWANRKIREERERCCDEATIARMNALPEDYGSAIVETLAVQCESIRPVPSLAVAGPVKNIEGRIRTMLRPGKEFKKGPSFATVLVVLCIGLLIVPTALVLTARAGTETTTEPKARPDESLHRAAAAGDIEQLKKLIAQGGDLNALDRLLNTPLCSAVDSGSMEAVQVLVEAGADVNAGSWSPLFTAVDKDNVAIAEYLIAHGADKHGDDYWPVLMEALYESSTGMVRLLITKGADTNYKSVELHGYTALHCAVDKGYRDIAELLIQKGVDVNAGPWTPLHSAAREKYTDMAELLIQNGADVNAKDHKGETPLYTAIRRKDLGMTRLLVSKGANLNVRNGDGYTPLCEAASAGNKDVLDFILANGEYPDSIYLAACKGDLNGVKTWVGRGTDVNAKDEFGWSPLHWAVAVGSRDVTEYLIDEGANPNVTDDKHGIPPLMIARDVLLAERLISKGADVRFKDPSGRTALHAACTLGIQDSAGLLLRSGAEINARDNNGATPLFNAAVNGHGNIIEFLISKGADVNAPAQVGRTPLAMASRMGLTQVASILRKHGARETLHGAAASGDKEGVKRLIEQGADVNARNQDGQTPLHLSLLNRWAGHARWALIKQGADVNAKTNSGTTPLMMAAAQGDEYSVEVFLFNGADVTASANKGETALSLAKENGRAEVVALLRRYGA
jgi:ankyrin repeat protein/beta-lactamase regulating signal transducer with metallopeptidase domain